MQGSMELDLRPEVIDETGREADERPRQEAAVEINDAYDEEPVVRENEPPRDHSDIGAIGEDLDSREDVTSPRRSVLPVGRAVLDDSVDEPDPVAEEPPEPADENTDADPQEEDTPPTADGPGVPPVEPPDKTTAPSEYPDDDDGFSGDDVEHPVDPEDATPEEVAPPDDTGETESPAVTEPPDVIEPATEDDHDVQGEEPRIAYPRGTLLPAVRTAVRVLGEEGIDYNTLLGADDSTIRKIMPAILASDTTSHTQISKETGLTFPAVKNAVERIMPELIAATPEGRRGDIPQPRPIPPRINPGPIESELRWGHGDLLRGTHAAFAALGEVATQAFLGGIDERSRTHQIFKLAADNPGITAKQIAERLETPTENVSAILRLSITSLYNAVPEGQRQDLPQPTGPPKHIERDQSRVGVWARGVQAESGMSVPDLAARLGMSAAPVWRFLRGGSNLNPRKAREALEVLGVDPKVIEERMTTYVQQWSENRATRRARREAEE